MSVRKMQKVRIDVEPKCISEDSEVRVYMSLVCCEREAAAKYSKSHKSQKECWRKRMIEFGGMMSLILLKLFVSLSVSAAVAVWSIPNAYRTRGYYAVGGEYLLILAAFVLSYWIMGYVIDE